MKPGLLAVLSLFAFTTSNALAHDGREGFGRVLFKTSCSPQAQKEFERALAQLHSFDFPETLKSFAAIPQTDPGCAISYWGLAVATRPNPLVGPWDAATLKRGLDAVEKGEAIGAKTQRERDWLVANKYAKIAPSASHAQHMPSHIYSMVGMWQESIASNLKSVAVASEYAAKAKLDGVLVGVPHSYDFMQYAHLQLGQDAKARELIGENAKISKVLGPVSAGNTARAAVPARYALERQDWKGAAQLQPLGTPFPAAEAITHFARAIGAARSSDPAAAQADIEKLKQLREGLLAGRQPYWAEQVEIQVLAATAWLHNSQGNREEALKFMRGAADLEDSSEKHVAMENRLYPMREQLGDMLRGYGEPAAALKEYEVSMKNAPNRLRGYYGAAKAAQDSGQAKKASAYYKQLARLTRDADGDRAEIIELKQYLASAK